MLSALAMQVVVGDVYAARKRSASLDTEGDGKFERKKVQDAPKLNRSAVYLKKYLNITK